VFLTLIPGQGESFEPMIIFGVFLLVWSNDTFAYLIGKSIGKHKLFKRVSPNKTIEGFLGGLIGSIIVSFIIFKYTLIFNFGIWMALAILVSVFGTLGDLIQSKFKRNADVKDSGILMPGHGGVYDRLDSIIFASPVLYTFLEIVNHVS
jgi:phosphatidate cytidylyltransferase